MMKLTAVLSLILLTPVMTIYGQTRKWTFSQCLDTALQKNISVNQSRLSNELNKVSLEQVKANRIPTFSASASEGLNFGKNVDPTTNSFVTQAYHSTNMGFGTSLNLFNGLQNANTIRQNRLNVEAGDFETEKVKNDVTLNITTGYLQVLFANEVLNAALRQEETTIAQVERTRKMVDAGKLPESDLLQIEAQLATENLSVINARNQLDLANVTLMQLMEIPVTDQFEVEVPVLEEPDPLLQTSADIYNRSLQVLPQIMGAGIRTNASMMALKVTEGARWPRLNFNGSLSSNYASSRQQGTSVNPEAYPFFTQMWDNIGQSFNFSLSIPIYSQRQIRSNIDRARINLMTTQLNEQNTKNTLRKSVEQTYADLRAAGKKFEATRLQLSAVESVYLNAEKKYNIGVLSATDYLIQKNNFTQTQSSLIQAKFDYIFKRKILDFYQGKTITF